jgi:hypothetical protein
MSTITWGEIHEQVNHILELSGYPSKWIEYIYKKIEDSDFDGWYWHDSGQWDEYGTDIEQIDDLIKIAALIGFYLEFKLQLKESYGSNPIIGIYSPSVYIKILKLLFESEIFQSNSGCTIKLLRFCNASRLNLRFNSDDGDEIDDCISDAIYDGSIGVSGR